MSNSEWGSQNLEFRIQEPFEVHKVSQFGSRPAVPRQGFVFRDDAPGACWLHTSQFAIQNYGTRGPRSGASASGTSLNV